MQKGFALPLVLAGVLSISLLAVGGYYFYQANTKDLPNIPAPQTFPQTQIENEVKDWKTYISGKYKYQLSYPSTWNQKLTCYGKAYENDDYICFVSPDASLGNMPGYLSKGVSISIYGDSKSHAKIGLSSAEFCESNRLEPVLKCEEIKVGEVIGWKRYLKDINQITVGLVNQNKIHFIIDASYATGEENTAEDTLNKLLPTFKFLDDETA